LLAQHPILLAQIVDCLLLLLIHPARDGIGTNRNGSRTLTVQPYHGHCAFSAFDFLDNTRTRRFRKIMPATETTGPDSISENQCTSLRRKFGGRH
jgi:hypothetical protein